MSDEKINIEYGNCSKLEEAYWKSRYTKEYQEKCDLEMKYGKQVSELKRVLEGIKSCIENPLTKYPEIVDYAHKVIEKVLTGKNETHT